MVSCSKSCLIDVVVSRTEWIAALQLHARIEHQGNAKNKFKGSAGRRPRGSRIQSFHRVVQYQLCKSLVLYDNLNSGTPKKDLKRIDRNPSKT